MTPPMDFDRLVLDRRIACPPDRLFGLMTDKDARAVWSAPDENVTVTIDESDIRPGGREVAYCGPKDAPEFEVIGNFHVVEAPHRLICTETLSVGGAMLSVSLVSQELSDDGDGGSKLTVTLQIASLSGPETAAGYNEGWNAALDNLERFATREDAA